MTNYVYITTGPLDEADAAKFAKFSIGGIKVFRANGNCAFSIRADLDGVDFSIPVRKLCDAVKAAPELTALLRNTNAQLCFVVEGSDRSGFPALSLDAETVAWLADLNADVSVDIFCNDEAHPE